MALLLATTVLFVRWVTSLEHAYRAVKYRQSAEERLLEGRLDEADELAAVADSLVPGDSTAAALRERLRIERLHALEDEIDRGDVIRAWRNWKKLRPERVMARQVFDNQVGVQTLRVMSDVPMTRVTLHAVHPDGRPMAAAPLYDLLAGPFESSSDDAEGEGVDHMKRSSRRHTGSPRPPKAVLHSLSDQSRSSEIEYPKGCHFKASATSSSSIRRQCNAPGRNDRDSAWHAENGK